MMEGHGSDAVEDRGAAMRTLLVLLLSAATVVILRDELGVLVGILLPGLPDSGVLEGAGWLVIAIVVVTVLVHFAMEAWGTPD